MKAFLETQQGQNTLKRWTDGVAKVPCPHIVKKGKCAQHDEGKCAFGLHEGEAVEKAKADHVAKPKAKAKG